MATLTDLGCISINSSWISLPATAFTEDGGVPQVLYGVFSEGAHSAEVLTERIERGDGVDAEDDLVVEQVEEQPDEDRGHVALVAHDERVLVEIDWPVGVVQDARVGRDPD